MRMQRIAENYYVGLPIAIVLVFLPLLNWLGLTYAVFTVLRQNTYVGVIAIALVGFTCFYMVSGMQFYGTKAEWLSLLAFTVPLWAMPYGLRVLRSLSASLQLGFLVLAFFALVNYAVYGPVSYDELYQFLLNRLFGGQVAAQGIGQTMQEMYLQTMAATAVYAWPSMLLLLQALLLFCARFMQSRWYYPGGFQTEFHNLRLAKWVSVVLLASFAFAIVSPQTQVAIQIAGLSILLFSIAGMAWLHWYIKDRELGKLWVVLMYIILFVLSTWVLPLLAVIGLLDSHLDLRARLKRKVT